MLSWCYNLFLEKYFDIVGGTLMTKELKKILELITDYKIIGDCEKIITGIEQDSR